MAERTKGFWLDKDMAEAIKAQLLDKGGVKDTLDRWCSALDDAARKCEVLYNGGVKAIVLGTTPLPYSYGCAVIHPDYGNGIAQHVMQAIRKNGKEGWEMHAMVDSRVGTLVFFRKPGDGHRFPTDRWNGWTPISE